MNSTGIVLSIGSQSWADNLLDLAWQGLKRREIQTASLGTTPVTDNTLQFGSETCVPESLTNPGRLKFRIQFDPDNLPKIDESQIAFFVQYPNQTLWTGTGSVEALENSDPEEEIMWAEYEVKISGNVTVYSNLQPVINDVSVNVVNDSGTLVYGA